MANEIRCKYDGIPIIAGRVAVIKESEELMYFHADYNGGCHNKYFKERDMRLPSVEFLVEFIDIHELEKILEKEEG